MVFLNGFNMKKLSCYLIGLIAVIFSHCSLAEDVYDCTENLSRSDCYQQTKIRLPYIDKVSNPDILQKIYHNACAANQVKACHELALLLLQGQKIPRNDALAKKYLDVGCTLNNYDSCSLLVNEKRSTDDGQQSYAKLVRQLEAACTAKDYASCDKLSKLYLLAKDDANASRTLQVICFDNKDQLACESSFNLIPHKTTAQKQEKLKISQFMCDNKMYLGCFKTGELILNTAYNQEELGLATQSLETACQFKVTGACKLLKTTTNKQQLLKNLPAEQDCSAADAQNCVRLADLYHTGKLGFNKDLNKALFFYNKACSYNLDNGCLYEALVTLDNANDSSQDTAAINTLKKLCSHKSADACFSLGQLISTGQKIAKDIKKANSYFIQACNYGER